MITSHHTTPHHTPHIHTHTLPSPHPTPTHTHTHTLSIRHEHRVPRSAPLSGLFSPPDEAPIGLARAPDPSPCILRLAVLYAVMEFGGMWCALFCYLLLVLVLVLLLLLFLQLLLSATCDSETRKLR